MPIPPSIRERVETFARNFESYLSPEYKETQLRREFLDPFFEALGWDVANAQGHAEAYKEVIHEDTLRIGGVGASAPDYSFRVGGTRKFFVEAKKPAIRIKDDPEPALQLRRYSWSEGLPIGIVSDFHEFAIYETRTRRPLATDKASVGRIFYCTFAEYEQKWDEIAAIFSREAVWRGSFDKFVASSRGKRGTSEFDAEFLKDMEHWRELLARNLALRNTLAQRDLNFAVQRILDRLIFLRIAEDRGIEKYGQLQALTAGSRIYGRFCDICRRADLRYNSGLFHFAAERDRVEAPDRLTLGLELDDAALKEVIDALYWPKSPYAFAVVPADILGHVYEQFLGKVIHLTEGGHRVRIEEKPEVRKAGGVYYTPTYIVDYIIRQTVGPLVEGKTPKQVEKLRVLDPACGSGSFLLGAFSFLLDWHLRYYLAHEPEKWAKKKNPPIYETAPNAVAIGQGSKHWLLTTAERKRILTNNLYGVDIDAQAVEVTKLSLLLKVLEGEARELQGRQMDFHRVLPDLGRNIKCGNSLIGSDFYAQTDLPLFDDEARIKLNAFDWKYEFADIMRDGGFDAVIGNPPWIDIKGLNPMEVRYYFSHYSTTENRMNVYAVFVERALSLVRPKGFFSFITPNSYLTQSSYLKLRRQLLQRTIKSLVRLPDAVFKGVNAETAIVVVQNCRSTGRARAVVFDRKATIAAIDERRAISIRDIEQAAWAAAPNVVLDLKADMSTTRLIEKISAHPTLEDLCEFCLGLTPYDKYRGHTPQQINQRVFHSPTCKGEEWKPLLEGADITRYAVSFGGKEFIRYGSWLGAPREKRFFDRPRILVRQIVSGRPPRIYAGFAEDELYNTQIAFNLLRRETVPESLFYILGVLNSSLTTYYHRTRFLDATKNTFQKILIQDAKQLPIPRIAFQVSGEQETHGQLVAHVDRMLKLHTDLTAAKSPDAQTRLQREIAATDRAIDALVYELYDLTPEEIRIVEEATSPQRVPDAPAAEAAEPSPAALPPSAPYNAQAEADAAHFYFAKEDPPLKS